MSRPQHPETFGPSAAAMERMNRMLLAFHDAGEPLTTREALDRLSSRMSRNDGDSAIRRLKGAGQLGWVPDSVPARYAVTTKGWYMAEQLIEEGGTY